MPRGKVDFTKKQCVGEYDWRECIDWTLRGIGTIFDIPLERLEEYSVHRINPSYLETEDDTELTTTVKIPVQRQAVDKDYLDPSNGYPRFNPHIYQKIIVDWEYLLERTRRFYKVLRWGNKDIQLFHDELVNWELEGEERVAREQKLLKLARQLVEIKGGDVQQTLKTLKEEGLDKGTALDKSQKKRQLLHKSRKKG